MLATLAMLLITALVPVPRRREQGAELRIEADTTRRDLTFFLLLFPIGIAVGAIGVSTPWRIATAAALLVGYGVYVRLTVAKSGSAEEEEPRPLYVDTTKDDPPSTAQIVVQFALSLAAIVGGAELFVTAIESLAVSLGVPLLVLALILAPLATELPEKANSVIWVRRGKDALAAGNITGAMAFQATMPVALGLCVTTWDLDRFAVVAGCVALAGGAVALWALPRGRGGLLPTATWAVLFGGFLGYIGVRLTQGSETALPSRPGRALIPIARRIVGRMSTERSGYAESREPTSAPANTIGISCTGRCAPPWSPATP